jgi:predicted nucleic acid-binding protein
MPRHVPRVPKTIYERAVFYDTGPLVALYGRSDRFKDQAEEIHAIVKAVRVPTYTSTAVIYETHARLLHAHGRDCALDFLEGIYDRVHEIVRPTLEDEHRAIELIKQFQDQDLTMVDALCCAIMERYGILRVFTFDQDFSIVGFMVHPPWYPFEA